MGDEIAVIPYVPKSPEESRQIVQQIEQIPTDKKAFKAWIKYKENKELLRLVLPVLLMAGSVLGLKYAQATWRTKEDDEIIGGMATNLTATAAVVACLITAIPGEGWEAMGKVGTAFVDKLPDGIIDLIF